MKNDRTKTATRISSRCQICAQAEVVPFYRIADLPVHCAFLYHDFKQARDCRKGTIELSFCPKCTMITNRYFDKEKVLYDNRYEGTQFHSLHFRSFISETISDLVTSYHLQGKRVIEIGCGRGEFLEMIRDRAGSSGVGFDPALAGLVEGVLKKDIVLFAEEFSEKHFDLPSSLVVIRMVLEHIFDCGQLLTRVGSYVGQQKNSLVHLQVPDAERIFGLGAFWDIYYEHCHYFSSRSLYEILNRSGLRMKNCRSVFGGQYLLCEAVLEPQEMPAVCRQSKLVLDRAIDDWDEIQKRSQTYWQRLIEDARADGRRVVIWGSGSKAVTFVTVLDLSEKDAIVVDINPRRHHTFLPGSALEIVAPDQIAEKNPAFVILMNPQYKEEVGNYLKKLNIELALFTLP